MVRAGCEQIQGVESLEKVALRHQEVFPSVETIVSLQECSHIMAGQLIREVCVVELELELTEIKSVV